MRSARPTELLSRHGLTHAVFGLEPTGNYHKPLAHWLIRQGQFVVLVSGKAVKDNRQLIDGRWDKNDTKDSANVADLISQGCQFYEHPDHHLVGMRNLLSLRKRLKKQEHSLKMRIRNSLLAKYFPEIDRYWGSCIEENMAIVRWYLDPRKIAGTDFNVFVRHVTRTDRGPRQLDRLRKIHDAAAGSVGMPVDASTETEAKLLVEQFYDLRARLDRTMKAIRQLGQRMSGYELLLGIPGVGPYIAALILSAIGDPLRFAGRKQVIRLAGLDLNANRSGRKSASAVPVISKRGDADLRYGLYQGALIASYHHPSFRRLYHHMLTDRHAERGIQTKIRVKLAAKILVIAWTMLKNNEPFDPLRLNPDSLSNAVRRKIILKNKGVR